MRRADGLRRAVAARAQLDQVIRVECGVDRQEITLDFVQKDLIGFLKFGVRAGHIKWYINDVWSSGLKWVYSTSPGISICGSFTFTQKFPLTARFNLAITHTTAIFLTALNLHRISSGKPGMRRGIYGSGTVLMTL